MIKYFAFLIFLPLYVAVASQPQLEDHQDFPTKQSSFRIGVSLEKTEKPLSISATATLWDENSRNLGHVHRDVTIFPDTMEEDFTEILLLSRPDFQKCFLNVKLKGSNSIKEMNFRVRDLVIDPSIKILQIFETSSTPNGQSDFTNAIFRYDKP